MTRKDQLLNWLACRQRTYTDGMALFRALAPDAVKQRYGLYLERGADGVTNPSDPRFTQLVNCLNRIANAIRMGQVIPAAEEELDLHPVSVTEETKKAEARKRQRRIEELECINEDIATRISYLESDRDGNAEEIDELRDQIEQNWDEVRQLRKEVDMLSAPGVKVVTEASLPPALRKAHDRIKQIAPLYASLHADIANPSTPDEERKKLADKLCALDDERRKLWRKIDEWSEGKGTTSDKLRATSISENDNDVVRGYEIARQIKRLRQNIANSRAAAEKAKADGRQTVYENALQRIESYEAELQELQFAISSE